MRHPRPARARGRSDPRYSTRHWTEVALRIRRRDGCCMVVPGCGRGAQVADHIIPVTPDMPDALFYAESNLRGACRYHNNVRGFATLAARELDGVPVPKVERLSMGRSFKGAPAHEAALSNLSPSTSVVTADYTRADDGPA